jgi:hypothetical protein
VGTGVHQFNYGPGWTFCDQTSCNDARLFRNTTTWSDIVGAQFTFAFDGSRLVLFGVLDPTHGWGGLSIDGEPEVMVDFYSATRAGNTPLWTSPTLPRGRHTLRVRVTGRQTAGSSDIYISVDRMDVETD